MAKLDKQARDDRDVYDPKAPLASFVSLIAGELILYSERAKEFTAAERQRLATVVQKLTARTVRAVDEQFIDHRQDDEEDFHVPFDVSRDGITTQFEFRNDWRAVAAGSMLSIAYKSFPHGSWPWTAAREAGYELLGTGGRIGEEFKRVARDNQFGPVGALAMAELIKHYSPQAAVYIANEGLGRMNREGFRKDVQLILGSDAPLARTIESSFEVIRDLPEEDIRLLARLLPPEKRPKLLQLARALRVTGNRPMREVLAAWLDDLWVTTLRAEVAAALQKHRLAGEKPLRR